MAVGYRIVGNDNGAWVCEAHTFFKIVTVLFFVCIDEEEVESFFFKTMQYFQRIALQYGYRI